MKRIHRRIFRLNDRIEALDRDRELMEAELGFHRSINDDAQRDAVFGTYIDRQEAGLTAGDVRRFEKAIEELEIKRARLARKRDLLVLRLSD